MRKFCARSSNFTQLGQRVGYIILVLALLTANFGAGVAPAQANALLQKVRTEQSKADKDIAENVLPSTPTPNYSGVNRNVLYGTPVTFTNSSFITINDATAATPYPSTISVQGITNTIVSATVNLYGLSHSFPRDIDMLLVGPGGQKTILMSDVGLNTSGAGISNINISFDDSAASGIGGSNPVNGGIYKPSDNSGFNGTATDTFSSPAPSGPYSVTLSVFNNTSANGDWKLYIMDDLSGGSGSIASGWSITLYVLNVVSVLPTVGNNQNSWLNYPYSSLLQAIVRDENSNPLSGKVVTFTAPANGASGTFVNGTNVFTGTTDAAGLVTATTFTANGTAGSFAVNLEAENAIYSGSFSLTNINSNAPSTISILSGNNQTTIVSTVFTQLLAVAVKDSNNNPVNSATIVFSAPNSGASGTFLNNSNVYTATTSSSGIVIATNFSANAIGGTYNLTATEIRTGLSTLFTLTNVATDPIQFESSSYTTFENSGAAVMTLTRGSNNGNEIYASLKINNLTTSNADYSPIYTGSLLDRSFDPGTGTGVKETYKVLPLTDGKLLLAGAFTYYNSIAVTGVARLNANGSLDTSFQSTGGGTDGTVYGMVTQPDGKIIIVGNTFTKYNGVARNRIARLNSDGSLDTSFNPNSGPNNAIYGVAIQPDGKILIGGDFSSYAGVTRNRVARLNSDGSLDTTFATNGTGASDRVWTFAIQPDGKIVIGGDFSSYAGTTANRIARLNSDGTLDTSFTGQTLGANNTIWSLALQPDGKIIAGGEFTIFNQTLIGYIVRLNAADGSLDTTFLGGGIGANGTIRSLSWQSDGKLLFGGGFSTFNGSSLNRIGRLNADGTLDTSFSSGGSGPNNLIWTVAPYTNGSFLVGGDLTTYDGVSRNHIARAGGLQLYWPVGDSTPKTFTLPIVNDNIAESNEQLTVSLLSVSPYGAVGSPATTTLTISDPINILPISGGGQSTLVSTTFTNPIAVALQTNGQPVLGAVVTFTAPITGASGTFANGSNVFTGTTGANGGITTTLFTANAITGSYQVVVTTTGATASAFFTLTNLTNCTPLVVTLATDDGAASTCGTFSYALTKATAGNTISFALSSGNIITFSGSLTPTVPVGVTIAGGANGVVLNGNGVTGDGLRLAGNITLSDLTIKSFGGREIVTLGTGNKIIRVRVVA